MDGCVCVRLFWLWNCKCILTTLLEEEDKNSPFVYDCMELVQSRQSCTHTDDPVYNLFPAHNVVYITQGEEDEEGTRP